MTTQLNPLRYIVIVANCTIIIGLITVNYYVMTLLDWQLFRPTREIPCFEPSCIKIERTDL